MASWMIHLRIADFLLDRIAGLDPRAFVMGSIAPDSGVPNQDWSSFSPPKSVTHFYTPQTDGTRKRIDPEAFCARYFTPEQIRSYGQEAYSFFLGYYIHLLTDVEWSHRIFNPGAQSYAAMPKEARQELVERMKEDWYDLDFRYLLEHPAFRAFRIYEQSVGFSNTFMPEFAEDAFDNRREYICGFYHSEEHGPLYREYPFLTPEQADRFVQDTAGAILQGLPTCREI